MMWWALTRTLSESMMVLRRWAMVRTVQSTNCSLRALWMIPSVLWTQGGWGRAAVTDEHEAHLMSTLAVASSRTRILLFLRRALARHTSCF